MSAYYCGVQTRPVRYVDPEPAEFCDAEVEYEGDLCPAHDEPDDDYDHGDYLQEQCERAADYYRDFGD